MREVIVGLEPNRCFVVRDGLVTLLLFAKHVAQGQLGDNVVSAQLERFFERSLRIVELAELHELQALLILSGGLIGLRGQRRHRDGEQDQTT